MFLKNRSIQASWFIILRTFAD